MPKFSDIEKKFLKDTEDRISAPKSEPEERKCVCGYEEARPGKICKFGCHLKPEESEPMSAKYDMCFCPGNCQVHPPKPESWSERFEDTFKNHGFHPVEKQRFLDFIQTEIDRTRKEAKLEKIIK